MTPPYSKQLRKTKKTQPALTKAEPPAFVPPMLVDRIIELRSHRELLCSVHPNHYRSVSMKRVVYRTILIVGLVYRVGRPKVVSQIGSAKKLPLARLSEKVLTRP